MMGAIPERDKGRAWSVVAGCAIASTFSLMSLLIGTIPTLATEMEQDTGWSRGSIMGTIGIVVLAGALLGPYVGKLIDRQGARWWIIGSQIGSSSALVGVAFVGNSLATFYTLILLAAVITVGCSPVSYSKILVPWFDKKRGIALGLSTIGVGMSAIALPLITAPMAEAWGWHRTLAFFGVVALLIAVPVQLLFVRDFPRHAGGQDPTFADDGLGFLKVFAQTWKTQPHFRIVILVFTVMGMAHAGIVLNMVPMQEDNGMSKTMAAGTQSALGISLIFGRILGGILLDKFNSPKPLLAGILPAMLGIAMLGSVTDWRLVYLAACLIGLGSGIENDGIPYLVSRYFPQAHFAKLSAAIQSSSALALAFGPAMAAITHDMTGDYFLACMISTGLLLFVGVLVFFLPEFGEARSRHRAQTRVEPV
jgi:MFS family permease